MPHVFEIADRIHIARLGKRAAVVDPRRISMSDTVAVMTGAKIRRTAAAGAGALIAGSQKGISDAQGNRSAAHP